MTTASLTHLTAVSGANCAPVVTAGVRLAGLLGTAESARWSPPCSPSSGSSCSSRPSRASCERPRWRSSCSSRRDRPGGRRRAALGRRDRALAVDPWFARDFGFALSACATAGRARLRSARRRAGTMDAAPARRRPRRSARGAARLPTGARAARPGGPALRRAGEPARRPGRADGHDGGPRRMPPASRPPVGRLRRAPGRAGCPPRGSPSSPAAATSCRSPGSTWLPDAPGAALCAVGSRPASSSSRPAAARTRVRVLRVPAAVVLCLAAVPLGVTAGRPDRPGHEAGDWRLLQCDVGQGDAVLVRDAGATLLIDTGPDPAPLAACLVLAGVDRIDLAVLTHWDADHAGGVDAIAGRVDVVLHGPLDGAQPTARSSRSRAAGPNWSRSATGRPAGSAARTGACSGHRHAPNRERCERRARPPAPTTTARCSSATSARRRSRRCWSRNRAGRHRQGRAPRQRRPGPGALPRARGIRRAHRRGGRQRVRASHRALLDLLAAEGQRPSAATAPARRRSARRGRVRLWSERARGRRCRRRPT